MKDVGELSDEESWDHTLFYFRKTVRVLAADAEAQCEALRGSPGVAWELSRDVIAFGRVLLTQSKRRLPEEKRHDIGALIEQAERLPSMLAGNKASFAENLQAMRDPYWTLLRQAATRLLAELPDNDETQT